MTLPRPTALFAALALAVLPAACSEPADPGAPKPVRASGQAAVGGPFQLVDQNGAPRDQSLLEGKWTAVFFGFTYCPDVCPTTLQTLAAAQEQLGERAEDLQLVLVTVDPQRDTPAALKAYLDSDAFPDGVVGLTGTPEQVAAALKAYRVYAQKTGTGDDYLMDHSTMVYLMNPQGGFERPIAYGQSPEQVAEQIRSAMSGRT